MGENKLKEQVFAVVTTEEKRYIEDCLSKIESAYEVHFIRIFSTLNRYLSTSTKANHITLSQDPQDDLIIKDWPIAKVIRVLFLQHIPEEDSEKYYQFVNSLFDYADIDELIALYASLNTLKYPKKWIARCAEGVRNNMEGVQQAVMLHNKYPFHYLDENAWNQLILKSFFTNKNTVAIYGVMERMNDKLAEAVVDYIFERDAAKRSINPLLWIFAKFRLDKRSVDILLNRFEDEDSVLAKSIMLFAIKDSSIMQAKEFYKNEFPKEVYYSSMDEIMNVINQ